MKTETLREAFARFNSGVARAGADYRAYPISQYNRRPICPICGTTTCTPKKKAKA